MLWTKLTATAVVFAVFVSLAGGAIAATELVGAATVTDGDTIEIDGQKIRLYGYDAPEMDQSCRQNGQLSQCGKVASEALIALLTGKHVRCLSQAKDRYGRWIARCLVGNQDVGEWMVSQGYAVAYRRYSMDYVGVESEAKSKQRGIWAGEFVMPWDWRRGKRLSKSPAPSQACDIKGNISRTGERIYHTKDSPWYGRTKINEAQGERWFCSEEEARAAGWRAPRS